MASLWKHPNSPYYTACFTDKTGKKRKRSTKETNAQKALKIAQKFEEASRKRRTFSQARQVLQELHQEVTGEEMASVSAREHIVSWLAEKKDETKPSTMSFYTNSMTKFLGFLGARADQEMELITRKDVLAFRKSVASAISSTSTNHHVKTLRMMFKAARREGLISENPAEFVEKVKAKGGYIRRPFTVEEIKKVLAAADDEWRSMILFGIYSGQRLGDVARLEWSNVDLGAGELRLVTGKTGKRMRVPLAPPLQKHLLEVAKGKKVEGPLHPRAMAVISKGHQSSGLSNHFADLLASVGLRKPVSHAKEKEKNGRAGAKEAAQLSFHSLRHTAVTLLKEAGIPAAVVMEMIGHDSEKMSEHYTHVGQEAMRKAAEAMPDVLAK